MVAAVEAEPAVEPSVEESVLIEEVQPNPPPATAEHKDESKIEKKSPEPEIKHEGDLDEQCDMTGALAGPFYFCDAAFIFSLFNSTTM